MKYSIKIFLILFLITINQVTFSQTVQLPFDEQHYLSDSTDWTYDELLVDSIKSIKLIYNYIDVKDNIPLKFVQAQSNNEITSFAKHLIKSVYHGSKMYAPDNLYYPFVDTLSITDFEERMGSQIKIQLIENLSTGKLESKTIRTSYDIKELRRFLTAELWFYNNTNEVMQKRIVGICPIRKYYKEYDVDREDPKYSRTVWFFYPDIRKYMKSLYGFNNESEAFDINLDEFFMNHLYKDSIGSINQISPTMYGKYRKNESKNDMSSIDTTSIARATIKYSYLNLKDFDNLFLYLPSEDIFYFQSLLNILLTEIKNQTLIAYNDEFFSNPLKIQEVYSRLGERIEYKIIEDNYTGKITNTSIQVEARLDEIKTIQINEINLYNKYDSLLFNKLIGMNFIRTYFNDADVERKYPIYKSAFWVKYNDIENILAKHFAMSFKNDDYNRSYLHIFTNKKYSANKLSEIEINKNEGLQFINASSTEFDYTIYAKYQSISQINESSAFLSEEYRFINNYSNEISKNSTQGKVLNIFDLSYKYNKLIYEIPIGVMESALIDGNFQIIISGQPIFAIPKQYKFLFNNQNLICDYNIDNYFDLQLYDTIGLLRHFDRGILHGLHTFPEDIFKMTNLKYLNLSENFIQQIPKDIYKLRDLTYLNIRHNQLTSLPLEIGDLSKLSYMDLENNQITELHVEIGKLTNLTSLNLSDNQLTKLPAEIGNLINLTSLDLSSNRLTSLPSEIGMLTNLTSLDLYGNQLTSLPTEIGNLINLTRLSLSANKLTSFPAEFTNLKNLTILGLSSNQLTSLPAEIGKLTNLTSLDLSSNRLTSLPSEIGMLTNLTSLDLYGNQLTSLPTEIDKLDKLISINLKGNPISRLEIEKIWKIIPKNCQLVFQFDYEVEFKDRNYTKVISIYNSLKQEVIELTDADKLLFAQAHNYYGVTLDERNLPDSALYYYKIASEIKPDFFLPLYNLGIKYSIKDEFPKAILYYSKALAIDSLSKDAASVYAQIAPAYLYTKQFSKAEYAANNALKINPDEKFANLSLARAYLFQGKYQQAEEIYLKWKNEQISDEETGAQAALRQLKKMEESGIIPQEYLKDVDKIRKLLLE